MPVFLVDVVSDVGHAAGVVGMPLIPLRGAGYVAGVVGMPLIPFRRLVLSAGHLLPPVTTWAHRVWIAPL